ncbi:MAG: DMT family transporter [Ilumatobacteraceae bacterium]
MALALALLAAAAYGIAVAFQFHEAAAADPQRSLQPRLLLGLLARPLWLLGMVADIAGFALQTAALTFGSLAIVQPILTLSLVVSLLVGARLENHRLHRWEWFAVIGALAGISIFFLAARPTGHSNATAAAGDWLILLTVLVCVVAVALSTGRLASGVSRAVLFAVAAACAEALMAVIAEAFGDRLRRGVLSTFASWQPYAIAACGVATLLLVQSAYQVGRATITLPVLTVTEPVIAISIGVVMFGEHLRLDGWHGPIVLLSLVLAAHSLITIARRSPHAAPSG